MSSLKSFALEGVKDVMRGGPGFAATAMRARSGGGEMQFPVSGKRALTVRRGSSDLDVCRQIFRDEQYRVIYAPYLERLARFEARMLSRGKVPVILDLGANVGAAALWFHDAFPKAHIVSVEPDPANAALARRNIAGLDRIEVVEAAIGSTPGHVSVNSDTDPFAVTTERADSGCPVVTVKEAIARVPNGELFIAKVDIEGFEDDLFAEATDWIDQAAMLYIEPHDHIFPDRGSSASFQRAMGTRDFDVLIKGENLIYIRREG